MIHRGEPCAGPRPRSAADSGSARPLQRRTTTVGRRFAADRLHPGSVTGDRPFPRARAPAWSRARRMAPPRAAKRPARDGAGARARGAEKRRCKTPPSNPASHFFGTLFRVRGLPVRWSGRGPPPECRAASNASARTAAVAGRSAGARASPRITICSSSGGTVSRTGRSGRGVCVSRRAIIA